MDESIAIDEPTKRWDLRRHLSLDGDPGSSPKVADSWIEARITLEWHVALDRQPASFAQTAKGIVQTHAEPVGNDECIRQLEDSPRYRH